MLRNALELLADQEDLVLSVYDDHDGSYIVPGKTVIGNPSVGFGCNIKYPEQQDKDIALIDLVYRVWKIYREQPWLYQLSPWRQAAMVSMRYNLGEHGFSEFGPFISLMQTAQWEAAVADLKTNPKLFIGGLADRYNAICGIILTDTPPTMKISAVIADTTFSDLFISFVEQLRANQYERN